MHVRTVLHLACCLLLAPPAWSGTTGGIEGAVRDAATGEELPGAALSLPALRLGGVSDARGRFRITDVPVGRHDLHVTLLGYRPTIIPGVDVHPDQRTRLTIALEPAAIGLEEVVVTLERPPVQRDNTATAYGVSGEELRLLPVDSPADVLRLKPGVAGEGNVRGGRTGEVAYLLDGLPLQDQITGGVIARIPLGSVAGTSILTGGFEPEYGNALSGVVNIVTRSATDRAMFGVRADTDRLLTGTQTSRSARAEFTAASPLAGDWLSGLAAADYQQSDSRWWQDYAGQVGFPVERQASGIAKLEARGSGGLHARLQGLLLHRSWRDYEFSWRYNLAGLPRQSHTAWRIALQVGRQLAPDLHATGSVSVLGLRREIGEGGDIRPDDPYQYDLFLRYVVSGQRSWRSLTRQFQTTLRGEAVLRADDRHLLKGGGEAVFTNAQSDVVKYEPRRTYFGRPVINEPQLDFSSSYSTHPRAAALYLQDRIDLADEGILINAGLRYDVLDPRSQRPVIEAIPIADSAYEVNVQGFRPASWKHQVSPRLGAAMQLGEDSYFFLNIGWYVQFPLFDYLYTGLDQAALGRGLPAFTGNPDLEPERTRAYELSVRHRIADDVVGTVTYFRKQTKNLVDTKTFVPGDSKLARDFGYAEYVNTPYADAWGFETLLTRERGAWVTGEISYTYMVAEGTSGSAEDGFYIAQYGLPPAVRVFPLSWDQRHTLKGTVSVRLSWRMTATFAGEWHSGRPYTNYPTSTGYEEVDGGAFVQNNARMPAAATVDLKLLQEFSPDWWPGARLALLLDVRNLFNVRNVLWVDSNGRVGGELDDPAARSAGRRTWLGLEAGF